MLPLVLRQDQRVAKSDAHAHSVHANRIEDSIEDAPCFQGPATETSPRLDGSAAQIPALFFRGTSPPSWGETTPNDDDDSHTERVGASGIISNGIIGEPSLVSRELEKDTLPHFGLDEDKDEEASEMICEDDISGVGVDFHLSLEIHEELEQSNVIVIQRRQSEVPQDEAEVLVHQRPQRDAEVSNQHEAFIPCFRV